MSTFLDAKSADALFTMDDGYSFDSPLTTDGYLVEFPKAFCVVFSVSGGTAPTGTFDVQGSLDGVNYFSLTTLTGGSAKAFSNNGVFPLNFSNVAVKFIRAVVTRTSGSGTTNIMCCVV